MFTGIIQGMGTIKDMKNYSDRKSFSVRFPKNLARKLKRGLSIAIDGVCLTVVRFQQNTVTFEIMVETEQKTTLGALGIKQKMNIERSLTLSDEIGGHILSGHVDTKALIQSITTSYHNYRIIFKIEKTWMQYIFPKGFIALDGVSLTIVETWEHKECFSVAFLPETLKRTTFGWKREGAHVNVEIDRQTQAIVNTVTQYLRSSDKNLDMILKRK